MEIPIPFIRSFRQVIRYIVPLVCILGGVGPLARAVPQTQPAATQPAIVASDPLAAPLRRVSTADREIKEAENLVKRLPDRPEPYVVLATAFMHKARETGDVAYYTRAEAACNQALKIKPDHYGAARQLSWVYSGLHRFDEALAAAQKALAADPKDSFNYAMLGDALIELGRYDEAEVAIQKLADLRPDVSAFTRVAYLRELFGDTAGAIEMMQEAVRSSSPREPEHLAWSHVQLGNLLFNSGRIADAGGEYAIALRTFPDYHYALSGMGRVYSAQKDFERAIACYRRSLEIVPTYDTAVWLGELLTYLNRPEDAAQQFGLLQLIEQLYKANNVPPDSMIAMYYADRGSNPVKSLEVAREVAQHRQDVKTMDALSWALYRNARYEDALEASKKALRLGTQDAIFYYHAGMIQRKLGHAAEAAADLHRALGINPSFDLIRAEAARSALASMDHPPTSAAGR